MHQIAPNLANLKAVKHSNNLISRITVTHWKAISECREGKISVEENFNLTFHIFKQPSNLELTRFQNGRRPQE